jgi:hypothetical protein
VTDLDFERRERERREYDIEQRRIEKKEADQLAADLREVLGLAAGRRLVDTFLATCQLDMSAVRFDGEGRVDSVAVLHAVAWQDAARWWVAAIRAACPEREAQMRKESAARRAAKPEGDDDDAATESAE